MKKYLLLLLLIVGCVESTSVGQGLRLRSSGARIQPITAPLPPISSGYGTLADEQEYYRRLNWTWTAGQEPTRTNGVQFISGIDVHTNLEADDLWQNIVMWKRTGQQVYYDLADSWADYYRSRYKTEWQSDLSGFFGDHTFGWGLVEWAAITGDTSYLNAANAIGDQLQADFYATFSNSTKNGFNGLRGPGRILRLAVALQRTQWAQDIWVALRDSPQWSERTISAHDVGFWKELDAGTVTGVFPWATGATGFQSTFSIAVLNDGLQAFYDFTTDASAKAEVKRRMILMARYSQYFGLDSTVSHTGHFIVVDYPSANQFFHTGVGGGGASPSELLDPFYTCTQINTLVRGYLFTADTTMLTAAKTLWDRSSRATSGDSYPYTNRPAETNGTVGYFMNAQTQGNIYYASDGELTYAWQLFPVVVNGPVILPPPATTVSVGPTTIAAGNNVTVSWTNIENPAATDYIGLYPLTAPNQGGSVAVRYIGGTSSPTVAVADGSMQFPVAGGLASGVYHFRLFHDPYVRLATSQSLTVTGTTPSAPNTPTLTSVATTSYNAIRLDWQDNSTNEDGFRIERCSGSGCTGFAEVAVIPANVVVYNDLGLAENTFYRYKIRAYNNAGGNSSYSSILSDTTTTAPVSGAEAWYAIPNSSLRNVISASSWITCGKPGLPCPDGWSSLPSTITDDWNGGIVDPTRQMLILPANGGHTSWFWNDVWAFNPTTLWHNLKQAYAPYINVVDHNNGGPGGTALLVYPDGSPSTTHTYDGIAYMPLLDEIFSTAGPFYGTSGAQPPPRRFNMNTHQWSYGSYDSIFPSNGTCTGVNPDNLNEVWIRAHDQGQLKAYNVATNTYTFLANVGPSQSGIYVTCMVYNNEFWMFGSQGIWKDTPGVGSSHPTFTGDSLPNAMAPGIAYEPALDKVVYWAGGQTVYFIDLNTRVITSRSIGGDNPGSPTAFGTYKRFGRIAQGQYLLMNNIDTVYQLTLNMAAPQSVINFGGYTALVDTDTGTISGNHSFTGTNRIAVVAVMGDNVSGGHEDVTGCTINGSSMTLAKKATSGFPDTNARYMYLFYQIAPPLGSQQVVCSASTAHALYAIVAHYTGANQSTQPDVASVENHSALPTATTLTTSITPTTANSWVVMFEQSYDDVNFTPPTAGTGAVRRASNPTYSNMSIFDSNHDLPASSYSMQTTRAVAPTIRGINHILMAIRPN